MMTVHPKKCKKRRSKVTERDDPPTPRSIVLSSHSYFTSATNSIAVRTTTIVIIMKFHRSISLFAFAAAVLSSSSFCLVKAWKSQETETAADDAPKNEEKTVVVDEAEYDRILEMHEHLFAFDSEEDREEKMGYLRRQLGNSGNGGGGQGGRGGGPGKRGIAETFRMR